MNAFAVAAIYGAHLPVGTSDVRAFVRIRASDVREPGVDASLKLWTPLGVTLMMLRELLPMPQDLRDGAVRRDDHTVEYPAGCWTNGIREYELAIALPPRDAGDEMLATRVSVVVDAAVVGQVPIAVAWTDGERLIAATRRHSPSTRTDAAAAADLPTGPSPRPRHTLVDQPIAEPCPVCGLQAQDGDRFCECCGHELVGAQKS